MDEAVQSDLLVQTVAIFAAVRPTGVVSAVLCATSMRGEGKFDIAWPSARQRAYVAAGDVLASVHARHLRRSNQSERQPQPSLNELT